MSSSCGGGSGSFCFRRAVRSGEAQKSARDVRSRRPPHVLLLPMVIAFAVASELQFMRLYKGANASPSCEEAYFRCDKSTLAGVSPACSCHPNCSLYDACCDDVRPSDWRKHALPPDAFECAVYPMIFTGGKGNINTFSYEFVFLITKCPSTYRLSYVANLCAAPRRHTGSAKVPPTEQWVTDKTTGVTYSNRFCALCYGVPASRMNFWNVSSACIDEIAISKFGLTGCKNYSWGWFSLTINIPKCTGPYYAACPSASQRQMQEACANNPARYVYDYMNFRTYRNENCSLCASSGTVTVDYFHCVPYITIPAVPFVINLQGVLEIDYCPKKISTFAKKDEHVTFTELCPDTVFDTENCSETVNVTALHTSYDSDNTLEYRITQNGVRLLYNLSYTLCYRCQPKTVLNYTLPSDNLAQLESNETYPKPLFQVEIDGPVTVCSALLSIELPSNLCSGLSSACTFLLILLLMLGLALHAALA